MPIKNTFFITGRGAAATGKVERGIVKAGDEVEIVGFGKIKKAIVTSIDLFWKQVEQAKIGDNIEVLLNGIKKDDIRQGQVLAKPDIIVIKQGY